MLTSVIRLTLVEFRQLVLAKIAPTVFDPKRLAWILSFIPPMIELRRSSNKCFFWDALILHALEIPDGLPALPVLGRSNLNIGSTIIHLKQHFQDDVIIFCTALINVHPSLIFNQHFYDQIQAFQMRTQPAVMSFFGVISRIRKVQSDLHRCVKGKELISRQAELKISAILL